jgi:hypothetical protein
MPAFSASKTASRVNAGGTEMTEPSTLVFAVIAATVS